HLAQLSHFLFQLLGAHVLSSCPVISAARDAPGPSAQALGFNLRSKGIFGLPSTDRVGILPPSCLWCLETVWQSRTESAGWLCAGFSPLWIPPQLRFRSCLAAFFPLLLLGTQSTLAFPLDCLHYSTVNSACPLVSLTMLTVQSCAE